MTKDTEYSGYKNYETWNVSLWILNDEGLYATAREYRYKGYKAFVESLRELNDPKDDAINPITLETPDNVAWNDSGLDIEALDALLRDL